MVEIRVKRTRRSRMWIWRNRLTEMNDCEPCGECPGCMALLQEMVVDKERPGHAWRSENGNVVYLEDDVMEKHLGRKLKPNETVIIKNDNPQDCRLENLELVEIPDLGGK